MSISIDGSEVGSATFALGRNSSNGSSTDGNASNGNVQGAQGDPPTGATGAGATAPLWLGLLAVLIALGTLRRRYE